MKRVAACLTVSALLAVGALFATVSPAAAWGGDRVTRTICDNLNGRQQGGWLATTLDDGGYHGRRKAQLTKTATGHGKRWVGVIHVPVGKAQRAHRALDGVWFAQSRTRFVVPMRTQFWTSGGRGDSYRASARWVARKLGGNWRVVAP